MLTVKYISPEVLSEPKKQVKNKLSGHRTQAFIDALKREFFLEHNEKIRKQKQLNQK